MKIQQQRHGYRIGRLGKVLLGVWSVCLLVGFAVGRRLEPDPRGYGTHERLGLPACSFRAMFGLRCPSCGMTTSFAHFTRGEFLSAARTNAAGLLLAVLCAVQIPWCWLSIRTGRLWRLSRPEMTLMWLLLILCGVCVLQWLTRLMFVRDTFPVQFGE